METVNLPYRGFTKLLSKVSTSSNT